MIDKIYAFLTSSEGQGLSLRVKSFVALIIPLLSVLGITLVSEDTDRYIDSFFVLVFGIVHAYAWIRRNMHKQNKTGSFAP